MSLTPSFHFARFIDRNSSNRLRNIYLGVAILIFGLITSNAIGQTRRTPAQRRGAVNQTAPPVSSVLGADDNSPIDTAIVAESQRVQQRELKERRKLQSVLAARNEPSETSVDDLWRGYR